LDALLLPFGAIASVTSEWEPTKHLIRRIWQSSEAHRMLHSFYPVVDHLIRGLWAGFALLWLVAAFFTKRTVQIQSPGSRALQLALGVFAYILVFAGRVSYEPLNATLVPQTRTTAILGLVLVFAGLLFAVWARVFLGGNWSANVTLKHEHVLVRSGPYRFVRHPIYSGLVLGLVGTTLAFGQIRCLLGTVLALLAWKLKSSIEEDFMVQRFGQQYLQYRHEVKSADSIYLVNGPGGWLNCRHPVFLSNLLVVSSFPRMSAFRARETSIPIKLRQE
jgi:protein-S-isoprenylcysteine O-methyltransferase Ste14